MKNTVQKMMLLSLFALGASCSSDEETAPGLTAEDYVVDTASLMRHMNISGAVLKDGDIPVPAGVHSDNILSMPSTVIVTSNSMFSMPIETSTTDGRKPRMVFLKLEGSNQYYQVDLDLNGNPVNGRNVNDEHRARLNCSGMPDVRLPSVGTGFTPSYTNAAEVYVYSPPVQAAPTDLTFFLNAQYWSLRRNITIKALDVGTGDVQVSLTWDTQTDVDLWLTEPNGNKIYYGDKLSSTGGELDFDNTQEYGPENIFYKNPAPSGTYKVEVDYFSGAPQTTHYNVMVKHGNTINFYEGTLSEYGETDVVATFVK